MIGLLSAFQIKHWLADFCFQTPYMLMKDKPFPDFLVPLAAHAGVHALLTFCIIQTLSQKKAVGFAILDFALHALIDRLKANPVLLGQFNNPATSVYWVVFGLDQLMHQLTYILFISFAFCQKGVCEWTLKETKKLSNCTKGSCSTF